MNIAKLGILVFLSLVVSAGTVSFDLENDAVFSRDFGYTNGAKISIEENGFRHSIFQFMYTPEDITISKPIAGDRPYAGVLGYEFLSASTDVHYRHYRAFGLQLGAIGEYSFAKETQIWVHEQIGATTPIGWDNQISNGVHLTGFYIYKYRLVDEAFFDVTPGAAMSLGTITRAGANIHSRLGYNLPKEFRIINEPVPQMESSPVSVYLFAGAGASLVGYNHYLDASESTVESTLWVWQLDAGIAVEFNHIGISFAAVQRSKEFETEDVGPAYGILTIKFKF